MATALSAQWTVRRTRFAAMPAAALALLLAFTTPAAAAGNVGKVYSGWGSCADSKSIHVTLPIIEPAPVRYSTGNYALIGGSAPSQQVAFRANLAQWTGSSWKTIRSGVWWYGTARMSSEWGFSQTTWRDAQGRQMPLPIGFWNLASGTWQNPIYYRVWYEFYWFADAYRPAGDGSAWATGHQENRGVAEGAAIIDQTAYGWCKFPGPNWLASVS